MIGEVGEIGRFWRSIFSTLEWRRTRLLRVQQGKVLLFSLGDLLGLVVEVVEATERVDQDSKGRGGGGVVGRCGLGRFSGCTSTV